MLPGIYWTNAKKSFILATFILVVLFFLTVEFSFAQTEEPAAPESGRAGLTIHTVQEGENLTVIAQEYDVSVEAIRLLNHLRNADVLHVGYELLIPGGEGDRVAAVANAQLGDSLLTIARRFNTSVQEVLEANLLINRDYIPTVGQSLSVISHTGSDQPRTIDGFPHIVGQGQSILEIAAWYGLSTAEIAQANDLSYPIRLFRGQRLLIPGSGQFQDLPDNWKTVAVRPEQIKQGDTVVVYVEHMQEGMPTGEFGGQELNFIAKDNGYAALVGFDAFTPPGFYTLNLAGTGEQEWHGFSQEIPIISANYITQSITVPGNLSLLLDPDIREEEDRQLLEIYSNISGEPRWEGPFRVPVTDTVVTAPYGGGRSYNEGPVTIFHTGTDFSGGVGTPILAAANGTVIFNDWLELRGNSVIVDHGQGVMTGYYHLAESYVATGQEIQIGEPIGTGGSTGLSTGPHLHWDLRIMGVPVDGMRWTEEIFP